MLDFCGASLLRATPLTLHSNVYLMPPATARLRWWFIGRRTADRASLATSLALIGSLYPGATQGLCQLSRGHVLFFRTVPPAITLVNGWVNEKRLRPRITGSTLPHQWADRFITGSPPSITARYFSAGPSDSTSRWTPCPPEYYKVVASGSSWLYPAFAFVPV